MMKNILPLMTEAITNPPIPFDPGRQTLKNWATYCLRDRGLKVIYAQNADFAIEQRDGSKLYVKLTEDPGYVDQTCIVIVHDRSTNQMSVVAPSA